MVAISVTRNPGVAGRKSMRADTRELRLEGDGGWGLGEYQY